MATLVGLRHPVTISVTDYNIVLFSQHKHIQSNRWKRDNKIKQVFFIFNFRGTFIEQKRFTSLNLKGNS